MARGSSESTFFVDLRPNQTIGLTFFLPIYQGGSVSSRIRQSAFLLTLKLKDLGFKKKIYEKRSKNLFWMLDSIDLSDALKSAVKSAMVELEANRKKRLRWYSKAIRCSYFSTKFIKSRTGAYRQQLNIILYWLNLNMLKSDLNRLTIKNGK